MSMPETMAEYLVRLSADIDTNSFNAAMMALNSLIAKLKSIKGIAAAGALVAGFAAIGKSATDAIKGVAAADMEFKRLANQMWITKDSAKALSTAMKVMGVSEEDIAWIPELREQFFRLRNEMNQLATPVDADRQLKWIREIGYDIQSLQVKLKMLKEWVVYYLIKYLGPFIKELQNFIRWLGDKLGKNMPQIAKKIAEFLAHIVSLGVTAFKTIKALIGTVYDFVDSLPANVKKWGAVFATVGAFILAGPFGKFIIALGGALILLEDFVYYMNGWNSSKAMAPVWEKLLQFLEGDSLTKTADTIKGFLSWVADKLDYMWDKFVKGFDWGGAKNSLLKGLKELKGGVGELFDAISELFDKIDKSTNSKAKSQQRSFWESLGKYISDSVKALGNLAGDLGRIFRAVADALRGDFAGAAEILKQVAKSALGHFAKGIASNIKAFGGDPGADSNERTRQAMEYFQSSGNMTKAGAAGLSGNLLSESGMDPLSVEIKDGVDPEDYRERLLNHTMSRDDFISDGVGFGIAQWTWQTRKAALWDYAESQGKDVTDFGVQLEFLLKEMQEEHKDLYSYLQEVQDKDEATDQIMEKYEGPAVQDDTERARRRGYTEHAYGMENSFVAKGGGGGSFSVNPDSWWKSMGNNLFTTPPAATVAPATNNTTNTTIGDINIHVAGTNASANDIGRAVSDVLNARFGRGQIV